MACTPCAAPSRSSRGPGDRRISDDGRRACDPRVIRGASFTCVRKSHSGPHRDSAGRNNVMSFPVHRPRRLRRTETIRRMVRETVLRPDDLSRPCSSARARGSASRSRRCPAARSMSVDGILEECRELASPRRPGDDPLRPPEGEGRRRQRGLRPGRPGAGGDPRPEEGAPRLLGLGRRLPVRVHGPRALRAAREGARRAHRRGQRPDASRRSPAPRWSTRRPAPTSSPRPT